MVKTMLWRDIRLTFRHSRGRFFSICALLALGAFALVGLKVTGPNMRATAEHYLASLNAADLSVMADMGLDEDDEASIAAVSGVREIEYGYLKDCTVAGTNDAIRIFSAPERVSTFELVEGALPANAGEIAIGSDLAGEHPLGSVMEFEEKAALDGSYALTRHSFTVVGYVNSSELLSGTNLGSTQSGTGSLKGYAVVVSEVFDVDYYMICRLTFEDTQGLDPFEQDYLDAVAAHKAELEDALEGAGARRLATVDTSYQDAIDSGQAEIDDARAQLADAEATLADSKASLDDAAGQLASAKSTLDSAASQIASAESQIAESESELASAASALDAGWAELAEQQATYDAGVSELAAKRTAAEQEAAATQAEIDAQTAQLEAAYSAGQLDEASYLAGKEQIASAQAALDAATAAGAAELASAQATLDEAAAALASARDTLDAKQSEYDSAASALAAAKSELAAKRSEYESGLAEYNDGLSEYESGMSAYEDGLAEYEDALAHAEATIADAEAELADAQATQAKLEQPAYHVYNRREIPGSEGYRTYVSVSEIVDSLANIFPYFLYFVAALVVSTTMTRMVDEERIGAGTLKALGYGDADIMKKFLVYGVAAVVVGTACGVALGHTLLPWIVYMAYAHAVTLPALELHFHPDVALACLALALVVTLIPAAAVAYRTLSERPAALLLPKAPAAGSKVLLEHVTPLWSRLSFMRKVTARNLFRYKKRAAMTIFGVAGAACMLFAGFAVQNSIAGLSEKQFGEIIGYDLIVAENEHVDADEQAAIDELLGAEGIKAFEPVTYAALTKEAGAKGDAQSITLLVPQSTDDFAEYTKLREREGGRSLELGETGAVLSERVAKLAGVGAGDTLTFTDEDGQEHSVLVTGVCEMYMNHFMFMSAAAYEEVFGEAPVANAYVATLEDDSIAHTEEVAASFMACSGVKGVVQSTQLINMVDVIVTSLNKIMGVLIVIAAALAVVILYNLVTINVSERIRELSTIKVLGFYNREVTMYIYRETIALSAIGVPVGWLFGRFLQLYIIEAVPPESVMFDPSPGWLCLAVSATVVAAVVFALYFSVRRRLRRVDMLEALKSVD